MEIPSQRSECNLVWKRKPQSDAAETSTRSTSAVSSKEEAAPMVLYLPEEFRSPSHEQVTESMAQLSLSPSAVIFGMPIDKKYRHLKPPICEGLHQWQTGRKDAC